jgi:hypothetical protein
MLYVILVSRQVISPRIINRIKVWNGYFVYGCKEIRRGSYYLDDLSASSSLNAADKRLMKRLLINWLVCHRESDIHHPQDRSTEGPRLP